MPAVMIGNFNPAQIKEILSGYFNISSNGSRLAIYRKRGFRREDGRKHCNFVLTTDRTKFRVFGKLGSNSEREYDNLNFLVAKIPREEMILPRPIAILKNKDESLILVEHLSGFSNLSWKIQAMYLFPGRMKRIVKLGRAVLDRIYRLQKYFPTNYSAVTGEDLAGIPNQPVPICFDEQLRSIGSIPATAKKRLSERVRQLVGGGVSVRRGLIHGDLGLRNIMAGGSGISFIDWDFMKLEDLALFDPCYFVTMLALRGIQLFVREAEVNAISGDLLNYVRHLEKEVKGGVSEESFSETIWFAQCISIVDTLWWYEKMEPSPMGQILKQRRRQIRYLARAILKGSEHAHF
jgi:hypothetical protein